MIMAKVYINMNGFKKIVVKKKTWKTFKKVSELTNTPIAQILTEIAENLDKALNDLDYQSFNKFFFACAYDSSKRLVLIKVFEMLFGMGSSQREIERQTKKIIRDAIKKRKKEGVKA